MKKLKKVVCFGGGAVVPERVMKPLKDCGKFIVCGITSMMDNGGSTGQLREDFHILPPADIRRHLLVLSDAPQWKKDLWKFKFGREEFPGGHKGHSFANVFIGGLEYITKDYNKVLEIIHEFLEIKNHRALPATIDKAQVCATLSDGSEIIGEDEIDVPKKHNPQLKITNVFLSSNTKIYPEAKKRIREADLLIFGPGDLFSSIIPCFLADGMREIVLESKAKKILICSTMQKMGETNNFSVLDFTKEVEKYIGCSLDFVIYNTKVVSGESLDLYKKKNPSLIEPLIIDENLPKEKFVGLDLLMNGSGMIHDPQKVFNVLEKLVR